MEAREKWERGKREERKTSRVTLISPRKNGLVWWLGGTRTRGGARATAYINEPGRAFDTNEPRLDKPLDPWYYIN